MLLPIIELLDAFFLISFMRRVGGVVVLYFLSTFSLIFLSEVIFFILSAIKLFTLSKTISISEHMRFQEEKQR